MVIDPPKPINLDQLKQELAAAGIVVSALGTTGTPPSEIHTYDATGAVIDLPVQAGNVIAAHVAQPDPVTAEQTAARTDLKSAYAAAVTRLGQIQTQMTAIAGASSPTNAQVVAAVQSEANAIGDLALMVQRIARLVADALT